MSEKMEAAQDTESAQDESKLKSGQGVVDYLQAPRKKRKSFIVIAAGPSSDQETTQAMVRFAKANYPKFAVATPQNYDEFLRQFSRNIVLAIVDDHFIEPQATLDMVKLMKTKKSESAIPVLFLTRDPDTLINSYNKSLSAWHEVDEYIVPHLTPRPYLFAKIKSGVEERYRRRSRRYKAGFPVVFTVLNHGDKRFKGTVTDMSVHGVQLQADEEYIFNPRDQIIIHIPFGNYVKDTGTDIIRIAAKVRRIFISGSRAGLSWEHMSDLKVEQISKMLTMIVDLSLGRQASAMRARIAKADAEAAAAVGHRGDLDGG